MTEIEPLVGTPAPIPGESLLAYLLRLADTNGHGSPGAFLRYAKVSEADLRTIRIPLEAVAAVVGCPPETIEHMHYVTKAEGRRGNHLRINGHPISTLYTRLRSTPICVDCVLEDGFVGAYWHARHAVACPRHGTRPLTACPHCRRKLSWFRPGLLRCKCGYAFDHAPMPPAVDERMLGILELLRRRIMDEPIRREGLLAEHGYPVEHLGKLSLAALVGLIERFGRLARDYGLPAPYPGVKGRDDEYAVAVASDALRDWPHGYHRLLRQAAEKDAGRNVTVFGLRTHHESLWSRICKGAYAEDYGFLHEELLQFGLVHWRFGAVDPRLGGEKGWGRTRCGLGEIARRIGVQPGTARRMIETGMIDAEIHRGSKTVRYSCDLEHLAVWKPKYGVSYSPLHAAKIVGLPVSVLRSLRRRRLFHFECVGDRLESIHELDLQRLKAALGDVARDVPERDAARTISLDGVMRWKLGDADFKADVVGALLEGQLVPTRPGTDDPSTISLDREEVRAYAGEQAAVRTGLRSTVEASAMLGCDHGSILSLVERGHLEGERSGRGVRVREESLRVFAEEFVSCAWVASELGTSSVRLQRLCRESALPLLEVERRLDGRLQPFMRRADLPSIGVEDMPKYRSRQQL